MDAVMAKGHMMHTLDTLRHRYSLRHLVEDDVKASVLYNVPPCDVSVEIVKVKTLPHVFLSIAGCATREITSEVVVHKENSVKGHHGFAELDDRGKLVVHMAESDLNEDNRDPAELQDQQRCLNTHTHTHSCS